MPLDKGIVYLITNQHNGKSYVGKSERGSLPKRWGQHLWYSRQGKRGRLAAAIQHYGPSAFHLAILGRAPDRDTLANLEREFIAKLGTNRPDIGYNLTIGGEGTAGLIRTDLYRQRLSEALKRAWAKRHLAKPRVVKVVDREKFRQRQSELMRQRWADPLFRERQSVSHRGKQYTIARKERMSESATARQSDPEYRKRMAHSVSESWHQRKGVAHAI